MTSVNKTNSSSTDRVNLFKKQQKHSTIHRKILTSENIKFSSNLVLKNTQFFTNIKNYLSVSKPFLEAKIYQLHEVIDPAALCKIIVQNMYLLQVADAFKLKLWLSLGYFVKKEENSPNLHMIQVFQLYCFEKQLKELSIDTKIKCMFLENKFIKLFEQNSNRMKGFFLILEKMVSACETYFQALQKSQSKSSSNSEIQLNKNILHQFIKIYRNIIQPQKDKFSEPKILLKVLQQTKLFRHHSVMVKIVNSSLFYSFKSNSKELTNQLRLAIQEIKQFFNVEHFQPKYEKSVVKLMDNFFSYLCKINVIQITKSLKGIHQQDENKAKDFLSLFQYEQNKNLDFPTITASILIPQQRYLVVTPQLIDCFLKNSNISNFQSDKDLSSPKSLEFQISYTYAQNEIKIRCITDIDILVDNMDFFNYVMNIFNDELNSSVSINTIEKFRKSMTKRIQKVVAFKFNAKLKHNQEPLTKILEMIDIGILTAKIFTSQISKKSVIKSEEYQKRQKVCEAFRHYENIFRKVIKNFYSALQNQPVN